MIVFTIASKNKCRVCGATHAAAKSKMYRDVCNWCWGRFMTHTNNKKKPTETDFNKWLARDLYLGVAHAARTGVTGRCQAVSKGPRGWVDDHVHQCCSRGSVIKNNRRVCWRHRRATMFVGEPQNDAYDAMTKSLSSLMRIDPRFKSCVLKACARVGR
jgi:hypothetical protein